MIGDGMQLEHEIAASRYLFGQDYALSFHQLPHETNVTTWDVTTYDKHAKKFGLGRHGALDRREDRRRQHRVAAR
jgi:alkaline phosphatase